MLAEAFQEPRTQRIGPYEVLLDIGSGGMGTISLARATGEPVGAAGFTRLVAIKRPHGALASDVEVLRRFLDEARLLAQVHHANVVGIHQIGSDAGGQFLVLDYIEGGTLDELLSRTILRRKKLPPPVVLRIVSDVLAGLHAVHEAADVEGRPLRILHRDVSAQNVLVGKDGVARLADFGIAKAVTSSTVTDKAYLQGRVPYMAPEYLRRQDVDRRLDVYAMGVTLWTALTSELPWRSLSEAQIVHSIVFDGVPPLSTAGVTVAPHLQSIVSQACHRDPTRRYATAREMLDAIEELGRQTGWMASHAEVAAMVDDLLGRELSTRRAALAQRLSAPPLPAADTGPTSSAAPAASAAMNGRASAGATPAAASAEANGRAPAGATPPALDSQTNGRAPAGATPPLASAAPTGRASIADLTPLHDEAESGSSAEAPRSLPVRRRGNPLLTGVIVMALIGGAAALVWKLRSSGVSDPQVGSGAAAPLSTSMLPSAVVAASTPPALTESVPPALTEAVPPAPSATASASPTVAVSATSARPQSPPSGPVRGPSPGALPTGISTTNPYRNR